MDLFICLQFPRSDVKSHSQTHIESHLDLALRGLEATQHQISELVTVVKDQSQHIERQSQQIERQSKQIERQSQQIERQSQQIERMISNDKEQTQQIERQSGQIDWQSQQIERQSQQIERLMSKDKEQLEKMERLMSRVEDQSQQIKQLISKDKEQSEKMERSISTVQGQPPQRERRGPMNQICPTPFEWEIPNIIDFFKKATFRSQNLVSKPFYLFERGYKYLLQIKTRSRRLQNDLHVYIKVVPGEFDELLSWPCKEKVRVTWADQDPRLEKCQSNVIDFEKCKEPCSRPRNDDYHAYRLVLDFTVGYYLVKDTILIRVNRE